jgi:hypothetical protein
MVNNQVLGSAKKRGRDLSIFLLLFPLLVTEREERRLVDQWGDQQKKIKCDQS